MTREEKINFIVEAVKAVEGVEIMSYQVSWWDDDRLDKEVEWYDYLLGK